jgi:uncharacterized damage-inducible protein DinB
MNAFKEAIRSGLEEFLQELQRAIEGLTPAEARWQPTDHTNHIAWLVWHMARVEDRWVNQVLRGTTEVWISAAWAKRFNMAPESSGGGQTIEEVRAMPDIPLTDLMAYFQAVRAVTGQYFDQITDADLVREYRHQRRGVITGIWIMGHLLAEESQHTGQVALIRGMMRGLGA